MTHLHAAVARATDHVKRFYQQHRGPRPRGRLNRTLRSRPTVYLKRSFIG
jgi:hypothetical protein